MHDTDREDITNFLQFVISQIVGDRLPIDWSSGKSVKIAVIVNNSPVFRMGLMQAFFEEHHILPIYFAVHTRNYIHPGQILMKLIE